jgi:histidinol phosphatase-like PHP family hydrolase
MNPGEGMLSIMSELNIPVVMSSDSHTPKRVGADFDKGLRLLKKVGYQKISYFKERKRHDLNTTDVANSLGFSL